jgi:hypothetical protein
MKKVEVGSKWVAKVHLPESASILKGTVITVESLSYDEIIYSEDGEPDIAWYADPKLWYEHFEPYAETVKAIEVGSKWVAKVDEPWSALVYVNEEVTVTRVDIKTGTASFMDSLNCQWSGNLGSWREYFEPFGEDMKIDMTKVEDLYFDYPVFDDGQYILGDLPPKDNVNSPSHYGQGSIEAIDYIKDSLTKEEYIGYLRGNIAKYLHRWRYKNGLEDLKKAQVYLEWLISQVE